jgi:hypothetical protein
VRGLAEGAGGDRSRALCGLETAAPIQACRGSIRSYSPHELTPARHADNRALRVLSPTRVLPSVNLSVTEGWS